MNVQMRNDQARRECIKVPVCVWICAVFFAFYIWIWNCIDYVIEKSTLGSRFVIVVSTPKLPYCRRFIGHYNTKTFLLCPLPISIQKLNSQEEWIVQTSGVFGHKIIFHSPYVWFYRRKSRYFWSCFLILDFFRLFVILIELTHLVYSAASVSWKI